MSREKTYTPDSLEKAVNKYFKSITRIKHVTEKVDSGRRDEKNHVIYEEREVINRYGKPLEIEEYIIPPTIEDLAAFLGIHRSTWTNYCNDELYFDTTTRARGRIRAYLHRELLTREGKDIRGVMFDLQNNFGFSDKKQVEIGPGTKKLLAAEALPVDEREALLRKIAELAAEDEDEADG